MWSAQSEHLTPPSCGGVEAAEGAVTRERNSIPLAMTFRDLEPVRRLDYK